MGDDKCLTDFIFLCIKNKLNVRINHSDQPGVVFKMVVHDPKRIRSIGTILTTDQHHYMELWICTVIEKIEKELKELER